MAKGKAKGWRPPAADDAIGSLLVGSADHITGDLVASPITLREEGKTIPWGHPDYGVDTKGSGKGKWARHNNFTERAGSRHHAPGTGTSAISLVPRQEVVRPTFRPAPKLASSPPVPSSSSTALVLPCKSEVKTELPEVPATVIHDAETRRRDMEARRLQAAAMAREAERRHQASLAVTGTTGSRPTARPQAPLLAHPMLDGSRGPSAPCKEELLETAADDADHWRCTVEEDMEAEADRMRRGVNCERQLRCKAELIGNMLEEAAKKEEKEEEEQDAGTRHANEKRRQGPTPPPLTTAPLLPAKKEMLAMDDETGLPARTRGLTSDLPTEPVSKRQRADDSAAAPAKPQGEAVRQALQRWAARVHALADLDPDAATRCKEFVRRRIVKAHAAGELHSVNWNEEPVPSLEGLCKGET